MNRSVSVTPPRLIGAKATPTVHEDPGASDLPAAQVEDTILKEVPVTNAAEVIAAEVELLLGLVSVTVDVALE
jgi:hypothetical protein